MLIYLVPFHGTGYDTDNRAMWHQIHNYFIGTTSYDWIREFESRKYDRSAWLVLLHQYEVTDSENNHIILSK